MRNWVMFGLLFSSHLFSAPLSDVTVLQPGDSDPYVWPQTAANCSVQKDELIVHLGPKTPYHFSGIVHLQLKLDSLPQWNNNNSTLAIGASRPQWKATKVRGFLQFVTRQRWIHKTDEDLGGCEVKLQKRSEKKELAIWLKCDGLVAVNEGTVSGPGGGRESFEIPADHPIICKNLTL